MIVDIGQLMRTLILSEYWGKITIEKTDLAPFFNVRIEVECLWPGRDRKLVIPLEQAAEGLVVLDGWPLLIDDGGGFIYPVEAVMEDPREPWTRSW